jgi:hypothetical protein
MWFALFRPAAVAGANREERRYINAERATVPEDVLKKDRFSLQTASIRLVTDAYCFRRPSHLATGANLEGGAYFE